MLNSSKRAVLTVLFFSSLLAAAFSESPDYRNPSPTLNIRCGRSERKIKKRNGKRGELTLERCCLMLSATSPLTLTRERLHATANGPTALSRAQQPANRCTVAILRAGSSPEFYVVFPLSNKSQTSLKANRNDVWLEATSLLIQKITTSTPLPVDRPSDKIRHDILTERRVLWKINQKKLQNCR